MAKIETTIELTELGYDEIASATTNDSIIKAYEYDEDGERDFAFSIETSVPGSMVEAFIEVNLSFDEAMRGFSEALRFDLIES